MLRENGKSASTYTLHLKQDELASKLGISRLALNVHLRKLRDLNYIRTGRGFIDVTEKGLTALGMSSTPAFVLIKVSPLKRSYAYDKIIELRVL
jgi:DNA-binding Lrp family transcriptional regulator